MTIERRYARVRRRIRPGRGVWFISGVDFENKVVTIDYVEP